MYICIGCHSRYPHYVSWCSVCQDDHTVLLEPQRPHAQHRVELQAATARELVGRQWNLTESKTYPELRVGSGALVAVYGAPGSGKSTWATRWADGLPGPVVYLSIEERLGPTVGARLERCGVKRSDFHIIGQGPIDQVLAFCRDRKAVALVIDSISCTSVQPEELRRLLESGGLRVLLYLLQVRKDGRAAGANAYLHESDATILVADLHWHIEKSRYQEPIHGPVLPSVG